MLVVVRMKRRTQIQFKKKKGKILYIDIAAKSKHNKRKSSVFLHLDKDSAEIK